MSTDSVCMNRGTTRVDIYGSDGNLYYTSSTPDFQAIQNPAGTRYYYIGHHQVAQYNDVPGTTEFFHTNASGSPIATTNASAAVTDKQYYLPYGGHAQGSTDNPDDVYAFARRHARDRQSCLHASALLFTGVASIYLAHRWCGRCKCGEFQSICICARQSVRVL